LYMHDPREPPSKRSEAHSPVPSGYLGPRIAPSPDLSS
jgi:hypothetical protein